VAFYRTVAALPDHPAVIVPCYDAVYEAESGNSHILLQDLTESHEVAVERDKQITLVDNLPRRGTWSRRSMRWHACMPIGGNIRSLAREAPRSLGGAWMKGTLWRKLHAVGGHWISF